MPIKPFLFTLLFTSSINLFAQSKIDTAAIKAQLATILVRDQKTRTSGDSVQFAHFIDSTNLVQVEALISQYGWLGKSTIGAKANATIFLVIQHAELPTQEKYLPMLIQSVMDSQSRPCDLALLQDRVLMRQGKKQLYGSQVVYNKRGGEEFWQIEDEANVNTRREKMGLPPIEEYAKIFGIEYKLPAK